MTTLTCRLALSLLALGFALPTDASAGIGIRIGRFGVGVGGGGVWGGWYGRPYYYAAPYYSYSTPLYDSDPYGDSYTTNYRPGYDVVDGPVPNPPMDTRGTIEIVHDEDNSSALTYQLNQFEFEIEPGHTQRLDEDRPWVIEFHRGGDYGHATYRLEAGRYKFVPTPEGWDLVKATDQTGIAVKANPPPPLPRDESRVITVQPRQSPDMAEPTVIQSAEQPQDAEQPR